MKPHALKKALWGDFGEFLMAFSGGSSMARFFRGMSKDLHDLRGDLLPRIGKLGSQKQEGKSTEKQNMLFFLAQKMLKIQTSTEIWLPFPLKKRRNRLQLRLFPSTSTPPQPAPELLAPKRHPQIAVT